ncbi:MAG: mercuric reductase, partial [Verrucomicrobiota bacterium]
DSFHRFKELGIDVFQGEGRFTGRRTIEVDGNTLNFSKAVIATGARASAPPIPGLDSVDYLTNESIFNLTKQPRSMTVIGAGPIGCEMAQTFQRLGTDVTLVEISEHILIKEDADAAEIVQNELIRDGVTLALNAGKINNVSIKGKKIAVDYGEGETVVSEALLVAVGRAPNVNGIGLDEAGVQFDPRRGVKVDDHLQTANPRIFAAGDVCSRYQFTHSADFLARIVVNNALFDFKVNRQKASSLVIPWATYTDPQIAHVGITEHQAKENGVAIDSFTQPLDDVDRAILDGDEDGFVKIHVAKGTDTILGGTIVARHAGDMIGEIVMAMTSGKKKIGLGKMGSVIHPYPTQAEALRKTGDLYSRTRLTPKVAGYLRKWLAWQRGK